ncbi:hypothetical protein INR77_09050 [Erythrobacter sp. SCSIO 43205]|uniref:hypothetical protein n=1 Tax=Erythrobacter sp. SCSIO 43205 TaxID=2779361 RepID=UPI001CAA2CF6|nr:hypothetical protein [Erythrobacter sp. SCSIO 43205]UAB76994.1 hypothetical protein INR77_09050 [Erythrobacter sp. SCSIO 43205]
MSHYPEADAARARIASIPAERLRTYERETWSVAIKSERKAFDRAANTFELSEREYVEMAFLRFHDRALFEQMLTSRLCEYDNARHKFIEVNYWRKWQRDIAAHTNRALAAFERAASRFDAEGVAA